MAQSRDNAGRFAGSGTNETSIATPAPLARFKGASGEVNSAGFSGPARPLGATVDLAKTYGKKGGGAKPSMPTPTPAQPHGLVNELSLNLGGGKPALQIGGKRGRQPKPLQPEIAPLDKNAPLRTSTLDQYRQAGESTATQPSTRYGILGEDGRPSMSTMDTRPLKTLGGPLDIGPTGSFGDPIGDVMGRTLDAEF